MTKSRILFVDDEPHITAALVRSLRQEPYKIFTATSAHEGLELLAEHDIQVIVSDEQMPGMCGSEFLAEVRVRYPETIRMILTGQASLDATIRAINEGGVYRIFTKPCNAVDLKVTIRQALHQKQLVQQSRKLLGEYQKQNSILEELERSSPGIAELSTDEDGAIFVSDVETDLEELLKEMDRAAHA